MAYLRPKSTQVPIWGGGTFLRTLKRLPKLRDQFIALQGPVSFIYCTHGRTDTQDQIRRKRHQTKTKYVKRRKVERRDNFTTLPFRVSRNSPPLLANFFQWNCSRQKQTRNLKKKSIIVLPDPHVLRFKYRTFYIELLPLFFSSGTLRPSYH